MLGSNGASGKNSFYLPVLLSEIWALRASSIPPNICLRILSHGCASTNDTCKLWIHIFKTTNGREQNYESIRPNYEQAFFFCSRSHFRTTNANFPTTNGHFLTAITGPQSENCRLRMYQESSYETKIREGKKTTTKLWSSRKGSTIRLEVITFIHLFCFGNLM